MAHYKVMCSCGNVIRQCRCPGPVTETKPHPACGKEAAPSPEATKRMPCAGCMATDNHDSVHYEGEWPHDERGNVAHAGEHCGGCSPNNDSYAAMTDTPSPEASGVHIWKDGVCTRCGLTPERIKRTCSGKREDEYAEWTCSKGHVTRVKVLNVGGLQLTGSDEEFCSTCDEPREYPSTALPSPEATELETHYRAYQGIDHEHEPGYHEHLHATSRHTSPEATAGRVTVEQWMINHFGSEVYPTQYAFAREIDAELASARERAALYRFMLGCVVTRRAVAQHFPSTSTELRASILDTAATIEDVLRADTLPDTVFGINWRAAI